MQAAVTPISSNTDMALHHLKGQSAPPISIVRYKKNVHKTVHFRSIQRNFCSNKNKYRCLNTRSTHANRRLHYTHSKSPHDWRQLQLKKQKLVEHQQQLIGHLKEKVFIFAIALLSFSSFIRPQIFSLSLSSQKI